MEYDLSQSKQRRSGVNRKKENQSTIIALWFFLYRYPIAMGNFMLGTGWYIPFRTS